MGVGQFFSANASGEEEEQRKAKPSLAERTAQEWIRPGGGYDQWKKGDPEREKRLPIGGREPSEGTKRLRNPQGIKPVWDEDIKSSPEKVKDRSDPKPPRGYAYYAEPYHYKSEPVKKSIENAPLPKRKTVGQRLAALAQNK